MAYHPFRHLGLKVVAIAVATLLWLTVAGEHVVERGMRVGLEFRNKPPELEIVGDPPTSVDLRLRGSSAILSRLDPGEVVAVIDLASARAGSRLFHIRPTEVRAPYGVEVTQVIPGTLSLDLEKSGKRVVTIMPPIEGEPAPGYVVGRITSDPATVEVVGPESHLKQLTEATTEPVSIAGAQQRVRDVVNVGVADAALRLTQPQSVTVMVEILPAPVERELAGVPVRSRNLAGRVIVKVAPNTVRVRVRGRRDALNGLRPDTIEAFVDLYGLGPGQYNLRVQIDPSQDYGVGEITPQVVTVTIR